MSLKLDERLELQLREEARRLEVSAEELAEAAVRDLLDHDDEDFQRSAARVMEKNRELYRRLA